MIHVVAYDIASEKRLRRVASLCEDYGVRVQKSVFEFRLPASAFAAFWERLEALVDEKEDAIVDYPVGGSEERKVLVLGRAIRPRGGAYVF